MSMLYYAQNAKSNIFQRIMGYFVFANNIPKRFVKSTHKIDIVILYESICQFLKFNAQAVIQNMLEKTRIKRFFIFYNNINFYEGMHEQRIYNQGGIINYIAEYLCFITLLLDAKLNEI